MAQFLNLFLVASVIAIGSFPNRSNANVTASDALWFCLMFCLLTSIKGSAGEDRGEGTNSDLKEHLTSSLFSKFPFYITWITSSPGL